MNLCTKDTRLLTPRLELPFSFPSQLRFRSVVQSLLCHNGSEEARTDLVHPGEVGWIPELLIEREVRKSSLELTRDRSTGPRCFSLVIRTCSMRTCRGQDDEEGRVDVLLNPTFPLVTATKVNCRVITTWTIWWRSPYLKCLVAPDCLNRTTPPLNGNDLTLHSYILELDIYTSWLSLLPLDSKLQLSRTGGTSSLWLGNTTTCTFLNLRRQSTAPADASPHVRCCFLPITSMRLTFH